VRLAAQRAPRLRVVAAIAAANLMRLFRDRLGLFFIVALPLLIVLLFGVAAAATQSAAPVGALVTAPGALEEDLLDRLAAQGAIQLRRYDDRAAMEADVRRRILAAGIVVPADYDEQLARGESLPLELLVDPSGTAPAAVRTTLVGAIAAENVRLQTAQLVAEELDIDFDEAIALTDETSSDRGAVVRSEIVGEATTGVRPVDRSAAANLVLFVFITSLVGSAALIETRRLGVARRMLAAPTSARVILAGEALGRFAVAMLQGLIVIAGASLLFGAQWPNPGAVWVIVALLSLAGTGAAMLLGAVMSNAEQASGVAVPLGIGLGMLGGCMWPLEIVPPVLQTAGHATPHAWAMDALGKVLQQDAGLADILPEVGVLAGFAVVLLALAAWRFGRILRSGAAAA
jgi:ABC-2 type transport system permease protein